MGAVHVGFLPRKSAIAFSDQISYTSNEGCQDSAILRTPSFVQNLPPCAEFGVLRRIEENLPNGAENLNILLIFVNPFTYNG